MAKDTGLREEKCLGELPERFGALHTDYNGSGQEIYETTADRGPRSAETQNPKSQIPNKFQNEVTPALMDSFMLSLFVIWNLEFVICLEFEI